MLSAILIILAAIFYTGIINRTKSIASDERGLGYSSTLPMPLGFLGKELFTVTPPVLFFKLRQPSTSPQ
jgi:hypothetical protein